MGNKIQMALVGEGFCVAEKRFGRWEQRTELVPLIEEANKAFRRMRKQDHYATYKVIPKSEIGKKAA